MKKPTYTISERTPIKEERSGKELERMKKTMGKKQWGIFLSNPFIAVERDANNNVIRIGMMI
jgi:phage terminase small subunit